MSSGNRSTVQTYPAFAEMIPEESFRSGHYTARFARSADELEAIQRLRFEVFNLELGEGLEESFKTGLDEDSFDPVCHHLLVTDGSGTVIGTYRMQTNEMANAHIGYYSADEFDLGGMPAELLCDSIEIGRACIARDDRNRHVLFLLFKGLATYLMKTGKRYLFGCCSLTSQDRAEGRRVMRYLQVSGNVHPALRIQPQPDWRCYDEALPEEPEGGGEPVKLPKLFALYLRYGAKVCGPPALDRHFKTIDYLVLLDSKRLSPTHRGMYFA